MHRSGRTVRELITELQALGPDSADKQVMAIDSRMCITYDLECPRTHKFESDDDMYDIGPANQFSVGDQCVFIELC